MKSYPRRLWAAVIPTLLLSPLLLVACGKKEPPGDGSLVEIEVEQDAEEAAVPATFPAEMESYRDDVDDSELRYASAVATAATTGILHSKLLGTPYYPLGADYPLGVDGEPLQLLAQINFRELPALDDFPTAGLLQFYVSPVESSNQIWGMQLYEEPVFDPDNFLETLQVPYYFRVIYHADVDGDDPQGQIPEVAIGFLPVNQEARLTFSEQTGFVTTTDYRFEEFFGLDPFDFFEEFGQAGDLVWEQYDRYVSRHAIAQVGGYAVFAQEDPRVLAPDEDWVLLLQIDSFTTDDGVEVLWGDGGTGSFHIRRDDLIERDFSRVLYSWDSF